jgi:hypothetical protein
MAFFKSSLRFFNSLTPGLQPEGKKNRHLLSPLSVVSHGIEEGEKAENNEKHLNNQYIQTSSVSLNQGAVEIIHRSLLPVNEDVEF